MIILIKLTAFKLFTLIAVIAAAIATAVKK